MACMVSVSISRIFFPHHVETPGSPQSRLYMIGDRDVLSGTWISIIFGPSVCAVWLVKVSTIALLLESVLRRCSRSVAHLLAIAFISLTFVPKETPNLTTFGATEYMDGALILSVLKELLLRGTPSRGRGQPLRGRGLVVEDASEEVEDIARRRECKELEAIDLTGCVSVVFVNALTDFVNTHILPSTSASDSSEDEGNTGHRRHSSARLRFPEEPTAFVGLQRLSLRGAKSIPPQILSSFVTAFPSLTHLDLSSTRASPDILDGLAASRTLRLQSLSLARCVRLTGSSIRNFLVSAPAACSITELNLYGDTIFPNPMSAEDFRDVFTRAPCFTSRELVYLDISSAPLDQGLLDAMPTQTKLRSLGLSFIPGLPLGVVQEFIRSKAAQVEILTLLGTSPEMVRAQPRQACAALHAQIIRPLCTPPLNLGTACDAPTAQEAPTRLRVIEVTTTLFSALGAGAGSWRIVRSKGGRGWYVDTASGWVSGPGGASLRRDLEKGHPWRRALEILAEANGNVSSGIGWHARKMEVSPPSAVAKIVVAVYPLWSRRLTNPMHRFYTAMACLDGKMVSMVRSLSPIRDRQGPGDQCDCQCCGSKEAITNKTSHCGAARCGT